MGCELIYRHGVLLSNKSCSSWSPTQLGVFPIRFGIGLLSRIVWDKSPKNPKMRHYPKSCGIRVNSE
jgi:hypothetical protein